MTDLREELRRLADAVGEPVAFRELEVTRRRRERRRRIEGFAAGLAVLVAAAIFVVVALRQNHTRVPVGTGTPSEGAYTPPEMPYLWPENWTSIGSTPTDAQAQADDSDPTVAWRTDPRAFVKRFASDMLGWDGIDVQNTQVAPGPEGDQTWTFSPACTVPLERTRRPSTCLRWTQAHTC